MKRTLSFFYRAWERMSSWLRDQHSETESLNSAKQSTSATVGEQQLPGLRVEPLCDISSLSWPPVLLSQNPRKLGSPCRPPFGRRVAERRDSESAIKHNAIQYI